MAQAGIKIMARANAILMMLANVMVWLFGESAAGILRAALIYQSLCSPLVGVRQ